MIFEKKLTSLRPLLLTRQNTLVKHKPFKMPNWCENTVIIMGAEEDLKAIEDCKMSFQKLVPRPEEEEKNWYDWNNENWGTKWDIVDEDGETNAYKFERNEDGYIEICFNTAWSPPREFFCHLTEKMDGLRVLLRYFEGGNDFCGEALFWNGRMYEKDIEDEVAFIREHFWEEYGMDEDEEEDEKEQKEEDEEEQKEEKAPISLSTNEKLEAMRENIKSQNFDLCVRKMFYNTTIMEIKARMLHTTGIPYNTMLNDSEFAKQHGEMIKTMKYGFMLE
jgi:hypothetical protein